MQGGDELRMGDVVGGDFRVNTLIARGGMGAVYEAEQLSTGRTRALKLMHPNLVVDARARERFLQEARIGARVESQHIVEVVAAGVDEGRPWLAMEMLKGHDAAQLLERRGFLPAAEVLSILAQACDGLGKAHALGIVHLDLKPENLFVADSTHRDIAFTVKILDFGISKLVTGNRTAATATTAIGSPLFMAPEQADQGGQLRSATDVWAIGLIAFNLLTGRYYWQAANVQELRMTALFQEILVAPIVPASRRAQEFGCASRLPPGFDAWFARCVDRDPSARYNDAGAAMRDLQPVLAHGSAPARSGTAVMSPSKMAAVLGSAGPSAPAAMMSAPRSPRLLIPALLGVGAAFIALLLGVVGVVAMSGSDAADDSSANGSGVAEGGSEEAAAPAPPGCPPGMLIVPAATFSMGAASAGPDAVSHQVRLRSFCIDRTEVTIAAYSECEGECGAVAGRGHCNAGRPNRSQHPVNCVSWTDADRYCRWRGSRLPTEAEWELAARGTDGRRFPWGPQDPDAARLNARDIDCRELIGQGHRVLFEASDGWGATAPVGRYAAGAASSGAMDMAGNVWEWVGDWYGPYPGGTAEDPSGPGSGTHRVTRGGSWSSNRSMMVRATTRGSREPESTSSSGGFRCAGDLGAGGSGAAPAPVATPATAPVVALGSNLPWQPLRRPWTRLAHFGEEYDYETQDSLTWTPTGGPAVVLTVPLPQVEYDPNGGEDGSGARLTTVTLRGAWGNRRRPRVIMRYGREARLASPERDFVVYAGIREDGSLLVSMEELPQRGLRGGHSRRIILGWNTRRDAPRALAHWEGQTVDVPQLFRARAPR